MTNYPIFIVGMNGSGTTMLADSLGRHSKLYVFPIESKVLPYFISRLDRYGDLRTASNRRRLATAIGRTKPYWQVNGGHPLRPSDAELEGCSSVGSIVARLYEVLAARQGKDRWCEKSPMNIQHMLALAEHFPDAKFIHIIRDGRDAAQSFHRRWGFNARHTMWRWKNAVRDGRRQGAILGSSRYLEVRYEHLTEEPIAEMQRICRFVELPFEPSLIESSMRHMDTAQPQSTVKRIVPNSGKWQVYFSESQRASLEAIAGKLLSELGYPVTQYGDAELGPLVRRALQVRDAAARTRAFLRERGFRALPRWFRHLGAAAKQWSVSRY